MLDSGDVGAAHALYVQILEDANRDRAEEDILHRLHHNIGGCLTGLGDYGESIRSFHESSADKAWRPRYQCDVSASFSLER